MTSIASSSAFPLRVTRRSLAAFVTAVVVCVAVFAARPAAAQDADLKPLQERFAKAVEAELKEGITPAFSVAWILDAKVVHTAGYGQADWKQNTPATADTLYRAGSISKLFNAIATVQLAEEGKLNLDAPIQAGLPNFSIVVPFPDAGPITLRQLLCHRSGMIREAPVGGYLDPTQPTIEATLASVAGAALVNPPNTKTRYSNVGPTIAGQAVATQSGLSFIDYQQKFVLDPLGMTSSAWKMNDKLRSRLAKGRMRIARGDGEYYYDVAPEFELGTIPAGNLYTSATDLAKLAIFMLGSDASAELTPPLMHPASFEMMCYPQLVDEDTGFGLGFYIGQYRGRKTLQHSGAVYGFTTILIAVPEERLAVLVLSNADIAMAPVRRLADLSLDLLLEKLHGEAIPKPEPTIEVPVAELEKLAGDYESASYWAHLEVDGKALVGQLSGQPIRLTATSPQRFLADGRIMARSPFEFEKEKDGLVNGFTAAGQKFTRVTRPDVAPEAWNSLLGKYGPEFIPLVVSIKHGHLYGTIENEYDYRLTPLNCVTFKLPAGMYSDEQVVFQLDAAGKATGAIMANQYLERSK
jgi:serine beta-lactamase-like protein LACTB